MEMDSMHLDDKMEIMEDESDEQSLSSSSPDIDEILGDQQLLPRIGLQYQAEIPPCTMEYDQQLINKPNESDILVDQPNCFSLGLPIPFMWANSEVENINGSVDFENCEQSQIRSTDEHAKAKVQCLDIVLDNGKHMVGHLNLQPAMGSDQTDIDFVLPQESKTKLDQVERGLYPLPGSLGEPWKEVEQESFLLGLYIFGKNLNLVKRFVESKGMGDVLSFYYGKFYKSDSYCRWSECQKLKSRRFIHGQKIFTGWRQQELLTRLFSHASEECKNTLLEDSRKFGEGKMSFEAYVFTLKNTVGVSMFVEAVAIGKGKQDLTGTAMEPVKTNHMVSVHPEIPVGKACSFLTSADIIRFLTGDFRLSKARSSDLFWEAVWPRLLARGWHSEQPKDHGFSGSKNSLVFLIPGVKKFSRRKLVKGDHYFDSVSDVLNKVASDPGLLEIEVEAAKGSEDKEEHRLDQSMNSDGLSNKRQHYLQPRNSSYNRHQMQFTIVDTSLFQGAGRPKVRELRSLPFETTSISTPSSLSSESEQGSSEDLEDEEEETNMTDLADHMTDRGACADSSHCTNGILNNSMPNTAVSTIVAVENHESHSMNPLMDEQQINTMEHQFMQKENTGHSKSLTPATELQYLIACNQGESSCSIENFCVDSKLEENVSRGMSNSNDSCEDMVFHIGPPQNLSPASSIAKDSSDRSNDGIVIENCLDREVFPKSHEPPPLIDLNVPQVSTDFANDESFITGIVQNNDNSTEIKSILSESNQQVEQVKLADDSTIMDQQPIMNNRRQSTRNRPLTAKALEAFAYGYLSPRRKRNAEVPQNNSMPKASRRVRGRTVFVSDTLNDGIQNNIAEPGIESLDALCGTVNASVVGESDV